MGGGVHSEELTGHLRTVDPNESDSFDFFDFVRRYVDGDVSLGSSEEGERLVGWSFRVSLMDLQREICLMIHALKREWEQERLSLKEGSSLQPLGQGISLIEQLQQSTETKTGMHLHLLKEHQKLDGKLKHRVNLSIADIWLPKSLNSMIFELLITFPKLGLFRRLDFILTSINHFQQTETKNGVII